jgi:hypothetical protein
MINNKTKVYLAMALLILLPITINSGIRTLDINYELVMRLSSVTLLYGVNFYLELRNSMRNRYLSIIILLKGTFFRFSLKSVADL